MVIKMKVYTNNEFIKRLKWLVNVVPNIYYSGKDWSKLNKNGKWQFDCVVSIKSILWGFSANKDLFRIFATAFERIDEFGVNRIERIVDSPRR